MIVRSRLLAVGTFFMPRTKHLVYRKLIFQRNRKKESTANAQLTNGPDFSVVFIKEFFAQFQTQTSAPFFIGAMSRLNGVSSKQHIQLFLGHAHTCVSNRNGQFFVVTRMIENDGMFFIAELNGIR